MGMRKGASDLFLAIPVYPEHGYWLEVKQNRKYTPSEMRTPTWLGQEAFMKDMRYMGYRADFVYGWEHGKLLIEKYLTDLHVITPFPL
jgi:hypothetical protein